MKRTRVMMAADALSDFMEQHSEQLYQYNSLCREAREGIEVERGGKLVKVVNVDLLHFAYKTYKPFVRQYMVLKYELLSISKLSLLWSDNLEFCLRASCEAKKPVISVKFPFFKSESSRSKVRSETICALLWARVIKKSMRAVK